MKYFVQTKAPAGNWTDYLGSERVSCLETALWLIESHDLPAENVRVIERTDVEVWPTAQPEKARVTMAVALQTVDKIIENLHSSDFVVEYGIMALNALAKEYRADMATDIMELL